MLGELDPHTNEFGVEAVVGVLTVAMQACVGRERGGCQQGGCVGLLLVFLLCLVRNAMCLPSLACGCSRIPAVGVSTAAGGVLFMPRGYMLSAPHQRCI